MGVDDAISVITAALENSEASSAKTRIAAALSAYTDADHTRAVTVSAGMLDRCAVHEASHAVCAIRWGLQLGVTRMHGDGSGSCEYFAMDAGALRLLVMPIVDLAGIAGELLLASVDQTRRETLARSSDLLKGRLALDALRAAGWNLSAKALATMSALAIQSNGREIARVAAALRTLTSLHAEEVCALAAHREAA